MQRIILILFITLSSFNMTAGDGLQKGISSYDAQKYGEAINYFEEEIKSEGGNSALYYNLGTAYMKTKNLAKARLNLERALLLTPYNNDVINNLSILNDRIETTVLPLEDFFLKRWWRGFSQMFSPNVWATLTVFLSLVMVFLTYLLWFRKPERKKFFLSFYYGILAIAGITILAGLTRFNLIHNSNFAVVTKTVDLKSSASDTSEAQNKLSPGVKVHINEELAGWLKVSTLDLEEGWIKSSDIEKI